MTIAITRAGTTETVWEQWLASESWPELELDVGGRGVVVVAAHPDDEVLAVGGLLARLAPQTPIRIVWATDGEASHPESCAIRPVDLAAVRREESRRALSRLGVAPVAVHHLALPDGRVADHEKQLSEQLARIVTDDVVVLANWSGDGHPDHEAVGRVTQAIAATCWHYPIWAWDWASPRDDRVPWNRLRVIRGIDVARKAGALSMFVSQIEALSPRPEDAAILPPGVLAHFHRAFEVVFV